MQLFYYLGSPGALAERALSRSPRRMHAFVCVATRFTAFPPGKHMKKRRPREEIQDTGKRSKKSVFPEFLLGLHPLIENLPPAFAPVFFLNGQSLPGKQGKSFHPVPVDF